MKTVTLSFMTLCWYALLAAEVPALVDAAKTEPSMVVDIRYFGTDNFVGKRIDGYEAPRCLLTPAAADALRGVQQHLAPFGLGLKVFDCYRPQRAVDHFVRWANDLNDTRQKARFYPDVPKNELFARGYIAARSGHSRGSTVDLTLVDLASGRELDMGTPFDYFSPRSWPQDARSTPAQRAHRMLLRTVMRAEGFKPLREEWWHFTLENEPYPVTYFDLPVR